FEVSTDKVDSEVPSPVTGVLTEILVPEGETVDVGERLCVVSEPGDATAPVPPPATESSSEPVTAPVSPSPPPAPTEPVTAPVPPPHPPPPTEPVTAPARPAATAVAEAAEVAGGGAVISPLVRRLMTEHGIEAGDVPGTGVGGRITRSDVERLIGTGRTTGVGSPTPAELSASV
ncbi:MAG: 2-oxoglutarate dehydrogenase, E2 component, dihydrolipoamide succinyltransferase, partial [Hyphomicrobiales bacterium]|nr:2-oxoglutarate dehydrogenase, E2 component, dihydrolipoamide succinyltransferase [Hyphomicrobiales bacterium]